MEIRKIVPSEVGLLAQLCDYNDLKDMVRTNSFLLESGNGDIFVLFEDGELIGELRVKYRDDDEEEAAVFGRRALLFAFRIKERFQGSGYGQHLMKYVLNTLEEKGYTEMSIGVETENSRAYHIYQKYGFTKFLSHRNETYQGDTFEYDLYLRLVGMNSI